MWYLETDADDEDKGGNSLAREVSLYDDNREDLMGEEDFRLRVYDKNA